MGGLLQDDTVVLDDKQWKPIGKFEPSKTELLDSGFIRYEWSEFREVLSPRYSSMLIIDDNKEWVTQVANAFRGDIQYGFCFPERTLTGFGSVFSEKENNHPING